MTHANPAIAFKRRKLAELKAKSEQQAEEAAAAAEQKAEAKRPAAPGKGKRVVDPGLAHKKRIQEAKAAERLEQLRKEQREQRDAAATEANEAFQLVLNELEADETRLRALPRGKARDELLVNELLPHWRPIVEAYLDGDEEYPNPVLVLVMIWAFNVGEMDFAMRCADTAIKQDQRMPERFKRNVQSFVADTVLEWAQNQVLREESYEPHFGAIAAALDDWEVPDEVSMKYLKFRAKQAEESDPREALALYRQAFDIDPKRSKCQTAMAKLEKAVAKLDEAESGSTE
jgi:tetratricopeptide (TPR) repeat protein